MTTPTPTAAVPSPSRPRQADGAIHWSDLSRSLQRYALGLTRSHHEAEDLVQEALARLLDRDAAADPIEAIEPYAIRTVTRIWLTRQRSIGRRARRLARIARESLGQSRPIGHGLERAELLDRLDRAVARLPPAQRAALVLRTVEGLSYEAIANALGCSVGAARASLHLARKRAAATLQDERTQR